MKTLKLLPFVLLITTGFYKAITLALPVDITLLVAMLNVLLVFYYFIKSGMKIKISLFPLFFLFLLVLPAVQFGNFSEFSLGKTITFYTLTLLSAIVPIFLVKTETDLKNFNRLIVCMCTATLAGSLAILITSPHLSRLNAIGGSTIALGRACGILFLYVFASILQKNVRYKIGTPILCIILFVQLASGAKGPLLATVFTSAILFFIFKWNTKKTHLVFLIVTFVVLFLFISLSKNIIPGTSIQRIEAFVNGKSGSSTITRSIAYSNSMNAISNNIFGIGFGNSELVINKGMTANTWLLQPHNLILEAFLECGWVTGLYLVFLIAYAIHKSYKNALACDKYKIVFALLIFYILGTFVGSEMTDRMLFAFIGLALVYSPAKTKLITNN